MRDPAATAAYIAERYAVHGEGVHGVLLLDADGHLRHDLGLHQGPADDAAVFRVALAHGAASVILFRIGPAEPTEVDLDLAERLAARANAVGVGLEDVLLVESGETWGALRRLGKLWEMVERKRPRGGGAW